MARKKRTLMSATPVAEGVRFRIGSATAFAVRRENKDVALRIRREKRPLRRLVQRIPFVRGMARLLLSVGDLIDGISESAELEPQRVIRGNRLERGFASLFRVHPESLVAFGSGLMVPVLLVGMMLALPMAIETFALPKVQLTRVQINAVMCAVRVLCTLMAVWMTGQLRVVNRLCMYRGAINKVLNAYETHRATPDIEETCAASRIYRRSDAAFLVAVLAASLAAFTLIRTFTLPIQILVRVLIVFAAAGIVNEPIYLLERFTPANPLSVLRAPLMWLERLFVVEPHSQMVEVALCAFKAAKENNME